MGLVHWLSDENASLLQKTCRFAAIQSKTRRVKGEAMTQETAVEISVEVLNVACAAGALADTPNVPWTHYGVARQAELLTFTRAALQAAIPLVVEGLVGDEACATQAPVHLTTSEAACWSWGMNKRRNDILAKVKK
jgi:hypothetical protein